jgi:anti-sigma B factor antagonist
MAYSFSTTNNVEVLQVDDLLNPMDNNAIIKEVEEKIQAGSTVYLVDLSEMDYMNSSGLTFLISILTRARNAGGEVAIANLSDNIKKILLVTRLNNMFNVYSSVEEAVEDLQPV